MPSQHVYNNSKWEVQGGNPEEGEESICKGMGNAVLRDKLTGQMGWQKSWV